MLTVLQGGPEMALMLLHTPGSDHRVVQTCDWASILLPPGICPLPLVVPSISTKSHKGKPAQSSPLWSQGLKSSIKRQVCAKPGRGALVYPKVLGWQGRLVTASPSSEQSSLPILLIWKMESQVGGLEREMFQASLSLTALLNAA